MASIERTAYPRLKRTLTVKERKEVYTPTQSEIKFARNVTRGEIPLLSLLLLLKTFQRLGYFPRLADIPTAIVNYVATQLGLAPGVMPAIGTTTLYKYHRAIREYLKVIAYSKSARHIIVESIYKAAQVMDNPPDLINVAIAELVNQRHELPAFSTLDRSARRVRTLVNGGFFQKVLSRLDGQQIQCLEGLLKADPQQSRSPYNALKQFPKSPTLSHLKALLSHLTWLQSLENVEQLLKDIPPLKIQHFAAEAKALDVGEIRDFSPPKRYTLLLCLIYQSQIQARDNLVTMFLKRINTIHKRGKEELEKLREQHRQKTEKLVTAFTDVLQLLEGEPEETQTALRFKNLLKPHGGVSQLLGDCEAVASYSGNNYLPLLWKFYRQNRSTLFGIIRALELESTSSDQSLMDAINFLLTLEDRRSEWIEAKVELSFASELWQRTVLARKEGSTIYIRRHFEVCVFSYLAAELKSGDICIKGSGTFADYREQLLPWSECESLLVDYCSELGFASTASGFVNNLRSWLEQTAKTVDKGYPNNGLVVINEAGEPVLKRLKSQGQRSSVQALEAAIHQRLPERNLIDILHNVEYWINWTRHFGPLSGSEPKLERPTERYLLTTFAYGCNLGASQGARHMRGAVTPRMLSFINRRHINVQKLNEALKDIINVYHQLALPKLWGDSQIAAADGTKFDLYEENLFAEYHIRYGGYGGIAYHHVSDRYIALFSHFIPCGVWEAIYIIEGLLKNTSDIQPNTIHADTQGQSTPVFALAHLLGIKLMPRIRNWKDYTFFRPSKEVRYTHIDSLFSDVINWDLIETHWQDLLRVVLSIKTGKISSSVLLRKLGNYSRKNRLYQAFRELGRVVRTVFLLQYISEVELREQITAATNKVEAYNGFSKWFFFGGQGIIATNDPEEQEKMIKYNDLIANAVIFQNVVDMTRIFRSLSQEGYPLTRADVTALSPYLTQHIKRFGDYWLDLERTPGALDVQKELELVG